MYTKDEANEDIDEIIQDINITNYLDSTKNQSLPRKSLYVKQYDTLQILHSMQLAVISLHELKGTLSTHLKNIPYVHTVEDIDNNKSTNYEINPINNTLFNNSYTYKKNNKITSNNLSNKSNNYENNELKTTLPDNYEINELKNTLSNNCEIDEPKNNLSDIYESKTLPLSVNNEKIFTKDILQNNSLDRTYTKYPNIQKLPKFNQEINQNINKSIRIMPENWQNIEENKETSPTSLSIQKVQNTKYKNLPFTLTPQPRLPKLLSPPPPPPSPSLFLKSTEIKKSTP